MDTDDLSNETYEAVIIEAERFHHNLTLHFGLLAGQCDTEEECLNFDLYDLYDRHDFNTKFLNQRNHNNQTNHSSDNCPGQGYTKRETDV